MRPNDRLDQLGETLIANYRRLGSHHRRCYRNCKISLEKEEDEVMETAGRVNL